MQKMKKDLTELVFILDRSGSMSGLESDTVGGFNAMLAKQKREPGECRLTTVLFDDKYELLHDRLTLAGVRPITEKEYYVRGTTALLDAIGRTIVKIANVQRNTSEEERADKVLFVITTDGMENASREFTNERIKAMISEQKEMHGWEFLFLGANMDAVETASHFGIDPSRAASYHADSEGTRVNFETISNACCDVRASVPLGAQWKARINEDFLTRKK